MGWVEGPFSTLRSSDLKFLEAREMQEHNPQWCPSTLCTELSTFCDKKRPWIKIYNKMTNTIWKSKTRSFQQYMGCLSKFLSEHNKKWNEIFMGQTPLFAILTNTEYISPPIGPFNHAHHGAISAALLWGCIQNRFLWICCSGVGERFEINWSPLNQFHLHSLPRFYPPKSPLSLVSSYPNCPH